MKRNISRPFPACVLVSLLLAATNITAADTNSPPTFILRSPAVSNGGMLPVEYTGDGDGATIPLEWAGAPPSTKSYALIMHHQAPDKTKRYWILYNIPASVRKLPRNVKGVGTQGNNSVNGHVEYAPPHSKGPGPKTYVYTVYALSDMIQPGVPPEQVDRDALLSAMQGRVLATAEMKVVYSRGVEGGHGEGKAPPARDDHDLRGDKQ